MTHILTSSEFWANNLSVTVTASAKRAQLFAEAAERVREISSEGASFTGGVAVKHAEDPRFPGNELTTIEVADPATGVALGGIVSQLEREAQD